jgi:hypothetical protein
MLINSADIQDLDFSLLLDISEQNPVATFQNLSTAANPALLDWVFELISPSGTFIKTGNRSEPDMPNGWAAAPFLVASGFPRPNYHLEWGTYTARVSVADASGAWFTLEKKVNLCAPAGHKKDQKNAYGAAHATLQAKCAQSQLFVADATNYSYQGLAGTAISRTLRLNFPADETGVPPAPFVAENFSSGLIPLPVAGEGFQYFLIAVMEYDFKDSVRVRVKYLGSEFFPVWCNLDITPLGCKIKELIDSIENGTCGDRDAARRKLEIINPKFNLVLSALLYPQVCVDPWRLIGEINQVGGWDCQCCPSGIKPLAEVVSGPFPFALAINGSGDLSGTVSVDGATITLNLQDFAYEFRLAAAAGSAAFEVKPATAGRQKTYSLSVNTTTLADEILTAIGAAATLRNKLNDLVADAGAAGAVNVSVDPKCVLQAPGTCDYTFKTAALTGGIWILNLMDEAGIPTTVGRYFDGTNVGEIETRLNQIGVGVWTAAYVDNVLTLEALDNGRKFRELQYRDAANNYKSFSLTKECGATAALTLNQVLQALIDWACGLILSSIRAGKAYDIKKIITVGGGINTVNIKSTDTQAAFMDKLLEAYNHLTQVVHDLKQVSCASVGEVFSEVAVTLSDTAVLYGADGRCERIPLAVLAQKLFKLAQTNQGVKDELCKATSACGTAVCAPVTSLTLAYDATALTLTLTIQNTGSLKYRVGYNKVGTPGLLGLEELAAEAGATTTKVWAGVQPAQYYALAVALCGTAESAEKDAQSAACPVPGTFNVTRSTNNFQFTWGEVLSTHKLRVEIELPNGARDSFIIASNTAQPYVRAIPPGVYGSFRARALSVCHEANQWYSAPTPYVDVAVDAPASCPLVTKVEVLEITETTIKVRATKPTGGSAPTAYTLQVIPQNGGAARSFTANQAGDTVEWTVTGLTAGVVHALEVTSNCSDSNSTPYNAGTVTTTVAGGSSNSSIEILGQITSGTIQVDGSLVHAVGPMLDAQSNFNVANYSAATVVVALCDLRRAPADDYQAEPVEDAVLVSNGVSYAPALIKGQELTWYDIPVVNGLQITVTAKLAGG